MNGYDLTQTWYNFCFKNPDKIKPGHHALYFWCIELCNSLGWKDKFGLPTQHTMEVIGIKNYKTYSEYLKDLIDFGFIKMIHVSKNQYTSNLIALVKNTKAPTKAYTKALSRHIPKQCSSTTQSTVSIDKPINNETIKLINIEQAPAPNPSYIRFQKWILENAASVASMKEPFTEDQFVKITAQYKSDEITDLLKSMHNWAKLSNNKSAYLTFEKWMKKEKMNKPIVTGQPKVFTADE